MKTKGLALAVMFLVPSIQAAAPLANRVDEYLRPYVAQYVFNGVVLVASGDRVIFQKAYGPANAEFGVPNTVETRFAIGSISKCFTAIILERLFAEKKLGPDDPLVKWVPDFPSADQITVRHLRTHRSGLRDPDKLRLIIRRNYTSAQVVDLLKSEPIASKPGEVESYTTANYAILAYIIERVTGKTYAEVVKEYVYDPAKMHDSGELATTTVVPHLATGYMPDPFGHGLSVCGPEDTSWKVGGGSSYSTAQDLMQFSRALHDGTLLPKELSASIFENAFTIEGRKVLTSSGSFPGASANFYYFPDNDMTVVVLSNNTAPVTGVISTAIARIVFGITVASPAVRIAANPHDGDPRTLGRYRVLGPGWTFTIELRDGRPVMRWSDTRMSALIRISEDTWFEPWDWGKLQLKFDDSGKFLEGTITFPGSAPRKIERL